MGNNNDKKSFWSTLPGILTGIAAVISAIGGLILALNAAGIITITPEIPTPTPVPTYSPTPTPAPTYSPTPTTTPAPTTTISTFGNSVSNLHVIDNPSRIYITVDYTFLSEHGDVARIAAKPLINGNFPSNFSYSSKIITKGSGTVNLTISFFPSEEVPTLSTDQILFTMWNDQYGTFTRVLFDYSKIWNGT